MSINTQTLQVNRSNLPESRIAEVALSAPNAGEIVVAVDAFALTANNITYAIAGDKIGYWQFFPAEAGWGVIPVWGFADVIASEHDQIAVGERLYGYWPMGTHLKMKPVGIREDRLFDGSEHRSQLPKVYNGYSRCSNEPHYDAAHDGARMLLFPLYATSYCLYDFLIDNDWFGAQQVIIPSASSKTAIGLAYALADDDSGKTCVGVTSNGNLKRVHDLDLYDTAVTYDNLTDIDASKPSVIIDMSGNGTVLAALHTHLGDNMRFTSNVGITHYADNQMGEGFIASRSKMFFAPGHMEKRAADWGPGVFEQKAFAFWAGAAKRSASWLRYDSSTGMQTVQAHYAKMLAGDVDPHVGVLLSPADAA